MQQSPFNVQVILLAPLVPILAVIAQAFVDCCKPKVVTSVNAAVKPSAYLVSAFVLPAVISAKPVLTCDLAM